MFPGFSTQEDTSIYSMTKFFHEPSVRLTKALQQIRDMEKGPQSKGQNRVEELNPRINFYNQTHTSPHPSEWSLGQICRCQLG